MNDNIDNIYDSINETLSIIDKLNIPRKFKGDQLHAREFNDVVDKINEIKNHLNGPVHDAIINTTSYILDKINKAHSALSADKIPLVSGSSKSILDELNSIQSKIDTTNSQLSSNSSSIEGILTNIDSIGETLGIHTNKIEGILTNLDSIGETLGIHTNKIEEIEKELNDVDDKIDSSYTKAVASSKDYTDSSYEKLYTHINDTTLTFDYDVKTKPESQQQEKIIYDNNDDLYDGEYHD